MLPKSNEKLMFSTAKVIVMALLDSKKRKKGFLEALEHSIAFIKETIKC